MANAARAHPPRSAEGGMSATRRRDPRGFPLAFRAWTARQCGLGGVSRRLAPSGRDRHDGMSTDLAVVLVLLAAAIAMFAVNRPRMDAVALIMLTALPLTGVISMTEALAGFSDSSIVL